jgi:DNA gyrase/topoisomerase IV subunit B
MECGWCEKNKIYGESLNDIVKKAKGRKVNITRIKGWGEINADVLKDVAFNVSTRKLSKIVPFKNSKDKKWFLDIVSEDTTARKKMIGIGE